MLTPVPKVWDVTRGEKVGSLVGHENRVSCLGVSNDGISLCTGSWDAFVRNHHHPPFRLCPIPDNRTAQGLGLLAALLMLIRPTKLDTRPHCAAREDYRVPIFCS
jgi:hypothetical protein